MSITKLFIFSTLFFCFSIHAQDSYQVAFLKYNGGGDYYANPTALPNLVTFCNTNLEPVPNAS